MSSKRKKTATAEDASGVTTKGVRKKKARRPAYRRPGDEPEKVIQKRILDWLKGTGLVHWRQNSGWAMMGPRMIRLGPEGLPDVIVIVPPGGQFLGLEIKNNKGRLRPSQVEFAEKLTNAGGIYRVVRSLEQAQNAVAEALGHAGMGRTS